jgi:hypothetical protein
VVEAGIVHSSRPYTPDVMRPGLFALTGIAFFAYWALARPSFEATAAQSEWPTVLWFSATLSGLAVALPVFGRMVGGRWVARLALLAGAGTGVSSLANIFEDGLHIEWVFAVFIVAEVVTLVSLLALTVVIAATRRGSGQLLALVPAGTALGLLLFVYAGGIIMLATWLGAAAAAGLGSRARASQLVIANPGAVGDPP